METCRKDGKLAGWMIVMIIGRKDVISKIPDKQYQHERDDATLDRLKAFERKLQSPLHS